MRENDSSDWLWTQLFYIVPAGSVGGSRRTGSLPWFPNSLNIQPASYHSMCLCITTVTLWSNLARHYIAVNSLVLMFEKLLSGRKHTDMTVYLRREDSWMENSYKWTGSPVGSNSVWSEAENFFTHFCSPLVGFVVLPELIPQSCYIARCPKYESSATHRPIWDRLETKETKKKE